MNSTTAQFVFFWNCRSFLRTQVVIDRYKDMPSFQGIHTDCEHIVKDLKDKLKLRFRNHEVR